MIKTIIKTTTLAVTASAMLTTSAIAQAQDDVRLRLNWMYYGSHAGFALGKDGGAYGNAGINIDIRSGNGSSSAHRLVANGDSDFAYGSCGALIRTEVVWSATACAVKSNNAHAKMPGKALTSLLSR